MMQEFKILICGIILLFYPGIDRINAQILTDTASFKIIERCIDDIYNYRFTEADSKCNLLNNKYPGHPVLRLLHGMIIYWQNYPMLPGSAYEKVYIDDMLTSIHQSERKDSREDDSESLLVNLCARGMLLQYYAEIENTSETFPLAKSTYPHIRKAFKYTSSYYDFNFFAGLYNYYREAYPEAYPIYKAFAFLFPRGNKEEGIRQMQIAARYSLLLKAESFSFLAWISSSFEHNFQLATNYSKMLHDLYPYNTEYQTEYIRNLLLTKRYEEAEALINSGNKEIKNPFFLAVFEIFTAILNEKEYKNNKMAQQLYEKGLRDISPFSTFGNEYAAYAYFGLSRISEAKGDKKNRKAYHKKASDLAVFKNIDFSN